MILRPYQRQAIVEARLLLFDSGQAPARGELARSERGRIIESVELIVVSVVEP